MPSVTYGFTGKPSLLTVGSASYTVPAGKYAYITASQHTSANFVVDGTTLIPFGGAAIFADGTTAATTGTVFAPASRPCIIDVNFDAITGGGSYAVLISGNTFAVTIATGQTAGRREGSIRLSPNAQNYVSVTATTGTVKWVVAGRYEVEPKVLTFWAPTGTIISGGSYCAAEYSG